MVAALSANPTVAVFASSAADVDQHYRDLADEVGTRIGARNWTLVYGGTLTGMLRSVADSARAAGGRVVAVTLQQFVDLGIEDDDADELVVTTTLAQRKQVMLERSDAFVVLPGGLGTLDEAGEVLAWARIGRLDAPLVFVDHGGFWAPLLGQIEVMVREGMLPSGSRTVAPHPGHDVVPDAAALEMALRHHFAGD